MVITKTSTAPNRPPWRLAVVSAVLAGGIGYVLGWQHPPAAEDKVTVSSFRSGPLAATPGADLDIDLAQLHIELPERSRRALQAARDDAVEVGAIEPGHKRFVDAKIRIDAPEVDTAPLEAALRLKGDMVDHVDSDKWSMRIELEGGTRFGMSRFSIQHPKTRGFVAEWLLMNMARKIGLLAPRGRFVEVTIDGRPNGVYYLEEHLSKEMLEAQGRRDGPVVRFREETLWSTWVQHGFLRGARVPDFVNAGTTSAVAEIDVYERGRHARSSTLAPRMVRAIEQMRSLQDLFIIGMEHYPGAPQAPASFKLDAMQRLAGKTLDDLLVTDRMGDMLALTTLWMASHGVGWHQLRFYHDPVRDRLEPLVFDMGPDYQALVARAGLLLTSPAMHDLTRSDAVRDRAFQTLWRIAQPEFLDEFFAELEPQYRAVREAFAVDGSTVPATMDVAAMLHAFETALRDHAAFLLNLVAPDDAANAACRLVGDDDPTAQQDPLTFEVDVWNTTRAPVVVDGFRFGNGHFVAAAEVVDPAAETPPILRGTAVALPRWSRRQRFRVPADLRLVGLRRIQELKRAVRAARDAGGGETAIDLSVEYRVVASGAARSETLRVLRIETPPDAHRPSPPDLTALLDRHSCLSYQPETDRLSLRPGVWNVDEDLVLPTGRALFSGPGVTLRFAPGAVLFCTGPLEWKGTAAAPIVIEAATPETSSWAGILVLDSPTMSHWEHVFVRHAAGIARGAWQATGGVTFYHAPVTMRHCRIEDARGEDALNVFGTECLLVSSTFDGGPSDLFDGDFVQGSATDCSFAHSGEDAVDVSGSEFAVVDCRFDAIGDKAISVGERSDVSVSNAVIGRCSIAVAAKDASHAEIVKLRAEVVEQYALCAYVKKPEFGACRIDAAEVSVGSAARGLCLVQTGCTIALDGQAQPTEDIDVGKLYADKVLGK